MTQNTIEQFDPHAYIDDLIGEMGMQNEDAEKLSKLKEAMMEALCRQIFHAAAENIEDEVIDVVLEELKDETDVEYILREIVQTSPSAQLAMLAALDEFKEQTLEAFNKLKT